jgi:hypothetical protein
MVRDIRRKIGSERTNRNTSGPNKGCSVNGKNKKQYQWSLLFKEEEERFSETWIIFTKLREKTTSLIKYNI